MIFLNTLQSQVGWEKDVSSNIPMFSPSELS